MKALIADDDAVVVQMLTSRLRAMNFKALSAQDAVQAWVAILRNVPSVVVVDMYMPGGTGRAVLKAVKKSPKTQHIPVIAISASSSSQVGEEMRSLGADVFLQKPLDLGQFDAEISRLTGAHYEAAEAQPRVPDKPLQVLVADDDPGTRRVLESLLRQWDYSVVPARNGEEAIQILESQTPPRLAILDWMMPVYSGPELCARIRKRIGDPYTYLVLLTSKGDKREVIEGMAAGADDYMVKPFDHSELRVRMAAGRRIIELQDELLATSARLRSALCARTPVR